MNYEKACNILKIDTKKSLDVNEVKKKYRIQALKYHPDKCKLENATELFLEVNEAYNYLVNNNKSAYELAKKRAEAAQKQRDEIRSATREINTIKNEMHDIKSMIKTLLDRN